MRQVILFTFVLALAAVALASGAAAGGAQSSCPNGYDRVVVPQTLEQLQALPRIAAGLAANPAPYTAQELFDLGNLIDENDDGIFCLKDVSNLRGASVNQWGFFYGARDNDSAAS